MRSEESTESTQPTHPKDVPRVLVSTGELGPAALRSGAVWRHGVPGRGLDANVIRLPRDEAIEPHDGPTLDVLWYVVDGSGTLTTAAGDSGLRAGDVVHLPRET